MENKKNYGEVVVDFDTTDSDNKKEQTDIKQCRFDRVGFCYKGKDECEFLHVEETCEIYLENGYCNKVKCVKRHPRKCFYYERGYCRNEEDCRYLQRTTKPTRQCEKCKKTSILTYYCELCEESYCSQCTVREAHDKDLNKSKILVECKNVHL